MASVVLDFLPLEGYTKLHIFEAATEESSPGLEIETVIVDPVNPITEYTTQLAASNTDWFSIQWEDAAGGRSPMSDPIQGGTTTLLGEIWDAISLLDPNIDENAAMMIASAACEKFFGKNYNDIDPSTISQGQIYGLALFTIASYHSVAVSISSGTAQKWAAGLVSMDSGSSSASGTVDTDALFAEAARWLGIGGSVVAQMQEVIIAGGFSEVVSADISRLLIEVQ